MIKPIQLSYFILTAFLLYACFPDGFTEKANQKFGDQHFKTAIALIELHKVREGDYPENFDSLKYLGDWDQMIFNSVKYTKLEVGYELNLINGVFGKSEQLNYPNDFWNGLGLKKSNLRN